MVGCSSVARVTTTSDLLGPYVLSHLIPGSKLSAPSHVTCGTKIPHSFLWSIYPLVKLSVSAEFAVTLFTGFFSLRCLFSTETQISPLPDTNHIKSFSCAFRCHLVFKTGVCAFFHQSVPPLRAPSPNF